MRATAPLHVLFATLVTGGGLLLGTTVLSSCDGGSGSGSSSSSGSADFDASVCQLTFGDATFDFCVDGSPDVSLPGTSGGYETALVLRIEEITGSCKGSVTKDGICTLDPSEYTTDISQTFPPTAGPPLGTLVMTPDRGWLGNVGAFVRRVQPATSGTKTCNAVQSTCDELQGVDVTEPFLLQGESNGGTGELAQVQFFVMTLYGPSTCTGNAFFEVDDDDRGVPLSPQPTIAALRSGPVTLTGSRTFALVPGSLQGSMTCEFTVRVRPTNGTGE